MKQVFLYFSKTLPILGVCLGHQALGQAFGAKVIRARQAMHGKTNTTRHNNSDVFYGLNQPLVVTRYHSLVIDKCSLPDCFELTAWTEQNGIIDEIMGIQHQSLPLHGVQFHPESILSEQGHALLNNFLKI